MSRVQEESNSHKIPTKVIDSNLGSSQSTVTNGLLFLFTTLQSLRSYYYTVFAAPLLRFVTMASRIIGYMTSTRQSPKTLDSILCGVFVTVVVVSIMILRHAMNLDDTNDVFHRNIYQRLKQKHNNFIGEIL